MVDAVGHAFLGTMRPTNRFTRRYHMDGWDRTSERTVDWVSGCCMLFPRSALEEVGLFDEGFPLYGEELDIATRLHVAGRAVLYTPAVEIVHEIGVSTGRSRRMLRMHSDSIYRYYRTHRAAGWRRLTLPLAWATLRARAELEAVAGEDRDTMKAVVLVGGEGTRMRPLTETVPKPLLPLMDRRSLDHVLDHLARHGVHEVVLSSPYLEETFHPFIEARHGDPAITWITENHALGTGGAIVNALEAAGERAVLRAERRHPDRSRPHRDEGVPRSARGSGHDRAAPCRGRSRIRTRRDRR